MSVNEPTSLTTWISLSATPEDKELLNRLAEQDGNTSQSAMIRKLIRDEAKRRRIVLDNKSIASV